MNIQDTLTSTPATIYRIEADIIKVDEELARLKMKARFMQADAYEAVSAVMVDGKKLYSNADARDSAARLKLSNDPEWKDLQDRTDTAEVLKKRMDATIRYHQDIQKNARVLALSHAPSQILFEGLP